MKILFVVKSKAMENLGVMHLSAIARKAGADTRITSLENACLVAAYWRPDVIGMSVLTGSQQSFIHLAKRIRMILPDSKIIVGGPHATFFPEDFSYDDFQHIVAGEAECWLNEYLGCKIEYDSLDSLPFPVREDFPDMKIRDFITSRGCPFTCRYCLTGDTLILKEDMSAVPIKDIQVGDRIIGIKQQPNQRSKIVTSVVLNKWKTKKTVYEVALENGTKVKCSEDHRWLTSKRGWKYVTGAESGINQRPFLTHNSKIRTIGAPIITPRITDDYRKGYLSGMIRGDGHLSKHGPYVTPYKKEYFVHQFRLCLKDEEALTRTKEYLEYFGINTASFIFTSSMKGIRTSTEENYEKIISIIEWVDSAEYARGFLGGIYDAEGSFGGTVRISNNNLEILNRIVWALAIGGFKMTHDVEKNNVQTIRITGGEGQYIKFWQWTDPCILRKRVLKNRKLRNSSKVKSICNLGYKSVMYDITTSTENFIANGMVSHNCFNDKWIKLFPHLGRVRYRSVENVISEIDSVRPEFVYFQDSCFGVSMKWLRVFSEDYKDRIGIPFHCHLRPSQVTPERVSLLKEANCMSTRIALETASDKLRKIIGREQTSNQETIDSATLLRKSGIKLMIQNMLGLPTSNIEDDLETLEVNIRCQPDYAWASIFAPYPGTALGDECKEKGWYSGDYSDMSDSFFERSVLNFSEEYKMQTYLLQKVFALSVEAQCMPEIGELTHENIFNFIHRAMRKLGDRRLYGGVI